MTDVAQAVCALLWATERIPVTAVVDRDTVHVGGGYNRLSTVQQVAVLRAFCACSARVVCDPMSYERTQA